MPIDYSEYPPDWHEISERIRFDRAFGRCECDGKCGHHHPDGRCRAVNGEPHPRTGSKVVLTVAHLNHAKEDCRDENLAAMCQRCHLAYDLPRHIVNRKYGRHHRKRQLTLF